MTKRLILFGILLVSLVGCRQSKHIDRTWSARADTSSFALADCFWNTEKLYCNYNNAGDTTFHYWPQAHALDVFTDWYLRTGDEKVLTLFDEWYKGVPAANEGGFWNQYYDDMEWNGLATPSSYGISLSPPGTKGAMVE